ncbi:MAG TPA: phosphoribosylanthranilate isomerase [Opitutaceae bacterium]|nr:phosphoribosylanthranilate isomerase [Opitutaceae bacterium]
MINGIRLKVCGLTSLVDAELADRAGADFLGFVLHAKSPRSMTLARFHAMAPRLPDRKKVAVMVEPSVAELAEALAAGFDLAQVHFPHDRQPAAVAAWAKAAGPGRLWLAPRLPPAAEVPAALLALTGTVLFDAFHADSFGGTGQTADWTKFRRHREAYPDTTWILAGGLNPENIAVALKATGARYVDVNSGIEAAPGVKDPAKLTAFVARLAEDRG